MNIPPAVAYHFCLNLPTAFTQLRASTYSVKNIRYCRQKSAEETKYQIQSSKYMLHQGPRAVHAMRAREREGAKLCMPSPHAQSPCSDGATIDDHEAPSFPLTDMNKIKRWNMDKVNECGKAITASRSCSTASWRSPWSWRAGRPRRVCECCWMMHRGRRRDRGAASGSRFGISLHIWLRAIQIYVWYQKC